MEFEIGIDGPPDASVSLTTTPNRSRWFVEIHDSDNAVPDNWDTFLRAVRELAGYRWFD